MESVKKWLQSFGDGSGSGYGDGSGYGSGSGSGYGSGYGYGDGSGYGSGSGSGYGDGYGIKEISGKRIFLIDRIPTIITRVKLSLAKGFILNGDLTLSSCYVAKGEGYSAHGKTASEAQAALREKILENMDTDEAIEKFLDTFKKGEKYAGKLFYEQHHYLTGSCDVGREAFVRNKHLSLEDTFTVDEFIEICENAYGSEVIRELKNRWEKENDK